MQSQKIIPCISRVQVKVTHTTNDRNLNMNEKRESTDANTGMIQILELSYKELKAVIKKMLWMRNYRDACNKWKPQQKQRYKKIEIFEFLIEIHCFWS